MTPKEKAKEIFEKFYNIKGGHNCMFWDDAIICSIIAVDEILKSEPLEPNIIPDWLQPEDWFSEANKSAEEYWLEVKQEIEKL